MNWKAFGIASVVLTASATNALAQLRVDDAALRQPSATEWLTYGRDYAETHFSPLKQIDSRNVQSLALAWTADIGGPAGPLESTPLVSNGVLYATGAWNVVFALDARTGAVKWRWDPRLPQGGASAGGPVACCGPVNRGLALYNGKVYAGLLDGRLVAFDAATGRIVWEKQTTPRSAVYTITGAPRIVKGNVIIGNGGADFGVRGYVTAYDAETGEQKWRFYTVPGDPSKPFESKALERAASTWKGEWWKIGGGGTVWDSFAYDAENDLLYIGVGNGAPWSRDHRSAGSGDNLFLSSIVALRPGSGEYVWHYQTSPGDDWDYTATQNMILADIAIDGRQRKVIMQAPKNGFFYVLDRITGAFISAKPFAHVTWASSIEATTGRPVETSTARYGTKGAWTAPAPLGAHNWQPMSWNPDTRLAYIPGQNNFTCHRVDPDYRAQANQMNTGTSGDGCGDRPVAVSPAGFLVAWDPVAQRERWRVAYDTRMNSGTLTTAGNLVFAGTASGMFYAYDATTGNKLWESRLAAGIATPVTYEIDGHQYVSVLAGRGIGANAGKVWTFAVGSRQ